jgi:DNA polymerase-3 subunit gamma/tau
MSTGVFYRKYRPQQFSDLRGQEVLKRIIVNSILNDSFSHGYLFCGPRGTGKTTTARLFARAINDPEFPKKKDLSNYITDSVDIIEMDAASNRGIDEIRELRDNINYLPAELSYKVYIIDEAHMLTKEAFNALLKTLEEPPKHVVFILATTEPHKIPVTIMSRVTRFDFRLADEDILLEKLNYIVGEEDLKIDKDALRKIFLLSGGSFRDAESILSKIVQSVSGKSVSGEDVDSVFGILPEAHLNKFVDALESGQKDELKNLVEDVDDEYIDFVVEEIISTLLNRGSDSKYISLMIDIAKSLKSFRNKKLYILARIYSFEDKKSKKSNQSIGLTVKEKEDTEKTIKKEEPAKDREEIVDDSELIRSIAGALEKSDKRLGVVFSTCQVKSRTDKGIEIANPYKFNINYLSQKKNKDQIIEECRSRGLDYKTIKFIHERNSVENSGREGNGPLADVFFNDNGEKSDKQSDKQEEIELDNSELVESLLN